MSVKQVIVIRKDLNMRKGKIASQAAHASMKVFLDRSVLLNQEESLSTLYIQVNKDMKTWLTGTFTKIVVSVESEEQLKYIHEQALSNNIPCAIIRDNGLTEFGGIPTYTAVAIGPAQESEIDKITGALKLL